MSAALTLPYVWATAHEVPRRPQCRVVDRSIRFHRRRTEGVLQRYLRASLGVGRVASVAEDVTLRGRASSYRMKNFEDVVIFTIDVENCLKALDAQALKLVVKIALQDYLLMDVAEELGLDPRTVARNYGKAIDRLTVEFMRKKLLAQER